MADTNTDVTAEDAAVEEKRPRVVVVGSANTDMVVRVPQLPIPGETLLGSAFALMPGGKGANQTEAAQILGGDYDPSASALMLKHRGVENVVVTLGAHGARLVTATKNIGVPAFPTEAVVDTTAAGDCFNGALAVALGEGQSLEDAVKFANAAASLSVEAAGAQPSLPNRLAVNKRLLGE